jgi:hypothetical protein
MELMAGRYSKEVFLQMVVFLCGYVSIVSAFGLAEARAFAVIAFVLAVFGSVQIGISLSYLLFILKSRYP